MCFCAGASFGAGAILSVAGAAALSQSRTTAERVLASIPLIFSVQQFTEGVLWLSINGQYNPVWQSVSTHLFLFFAQVVWPVWIPLSMFLFETNKKRKQILRYFLGTGILLSAYLLYHLFATPVTAAVSSHHIQYSFKYPHFLILVSNILYFLATVISTFISGNKKMNILGLLLLGSFLVSRIYFNEYVISVWCYFAALISLYIIYILYSGRKQRRQQV